MQHTDNVTDLENSQEILIHESVSFNFYCQAKYPPKSVFVTVRCPYDLQIPTKHERFFLNQVFWKAIFLSKSTE